MSESKDQVISFRNQEEFERAVMDVLRKKLTLSGTLNSFSLELNLIEKDCLESDTPSFCSLHIQKEFD